MDKTDIWSKLAAPLPAGVISWRQDGKPSQRDGKHFARFVAYIEANTVRERLDSVVPGEWDLTLELMPQLPGVDDDSVAASFKARLQILGVIREDVGTGKDYKQAATDAFKRAAVRFGIAHELYAYEQNWVQVDSDGKYAKPLEDPQTVYTRRWGSTAAMAEPAQSAAVAAPASEPSFSLQSEPVTALPVDVPVTLGDGDMPACPKCTGRMWDNRVSKRNPKAPDYKCRDRSCDGVVWPDKGATAAPRQPAMASADGRRAELDSSPLVETDDIPF
jgi:Rad52/22 family double-strand break repair protein